MKALLASLALFCVSPAAAQTSVRLYESQRAAEAAIAAFPDAGKAGSPLHERMTRLKLENPTGLTGNANPIILAVRSAAELQRERPEAAPNANDVAARCLGIIEKEYGPLNASSAFAKAFWDYVPEVRTQLPDFSTTGAWPLAAGALAGLTGNGSSLTNASKPNGRSSSDFVPHQAWLTVSGATEWPPRQPTQRPARITITQTSPDSWQLSDGTTITRSGSGQYQVGR